MHWYRCNNDECRTRISFKKRIEEYVRGKTCKSCGSNLHSTHFDHDRARKLTCRCDAFHFPHQAGSSVFCVESKRQPTDEDYKHRYG